MGMLNVYVVMAVVGFLAFVFIAESINPFRNHIIQSLKNRHRVGTIAGLLIALSALVNLVVPASGLVAQVKISLATSFFLLLPLVLFMLIKQVVAQRRANRARTRQHENRKQTERYAAAHQTSQSAFTSNPETPLASNQAAGTSGQANMMPATTPTGDSANNPVIDLTSQSNGFFNKDNEPTIESSANLREPNATATSENVKDQDGSASSLVDGSDSFSDNGMDELDELELKRSLTDQAPTPDLDNLAIGNSFPFTARVTTEEQSAANAEFLSGDRDSFSATDTHHSSVIADDLVDDAVEWHTIEDDTPELSEHDTSVALENRAVIDVEPINNNLSNETEISQLEEAMDSVTHQADAIQDSITRIQDLSAEELRYREQLLHAQVAFDNANKLQIEQQRKLIDQGEKQLFDESKQRNDAETELSRKRGELVDMQVRVKDLETELRERQRVFADQVSSLKKTREMARHAAHLARRAAMAQQRARAQALQERAAREKLEVSAKKAVDIARNAISKLAEEERKNRQTTH